MFELHYPTKPYRVNQAFGENANSFYKELGMPGHNGIDLYTPHGWIVRASHDGWVFYSGGDAKEGIGVTIISDEKGVYNNKLVHFKSIYWHLKMTFVKHGDKVKAGDIIGLADNTGMSTGDHLHFGIKPVEVINEWTVNNIEQNNGYFGAINPAPYWSGYDAEDYASLRNKVKELQLKVQQLINALKGR